MYRIGHSLGREGRHSLGGSRQSPALACAERKERKDGRSQRDDELRAAVQGGLRCNPILLARLPQARYSTATSFLCTFDIAGLLPERDSGSRAVTSFCEEARSQLVWLSMRTARGVSKTIAGPLSSPASLSALPSSLCSPDFLSPSGLGSQHSGIPFYRRSSIKLAKTHLAIRFFRRRPA